MLHKETNPGNARALIPRPSIIVADEPVSMIDASRRNPYERRFRSYSHGLAPINVPANALILSALAVASVAMILALRRRRPWDAAIFALSPALALSGLVNWDLLAVVFVAVKSSTGMETSERRM